MLNSPIAADGEGTSTIANRVGKRSRPPYYGGAACSHTQRRASRIVADALLSRVNLEGLAANNDGAAPEHGVQIKLDTWF